MDALERMQPLPSFVVRSFQGDIRVNYERAVIRRYLSSPLFDALLGADSHTKSEFKFQIKHKKTEGICRSQCPTWILRFLSHNTSSCLQKQVRISLLAHIHIIIQTMSLAIVAKVDRKGVTVVDSQTMLVHLKCGGLITLNFDSSEAMMGAAEEMAFSAAVLAPPVILVPETPRTNNSEPIVLLDNTPPPTHTEQKDSNKPDSLAESRDMLASSSEDEDDDEDAADAEDQFKEDELADGVHRINVNKLDDSFEDAVSLTQEFW
jgi:hypothetical protein